MAIRVGIIGVTGRMGAALVEAISQTPDLSLGAAVARDAAKVAGLASKGVPVATDLSAVAKGLSVCIDFSSAAATARHATICAEAGVPLLVGTTGLGSDAIAQLDLAANRVPVLVAANTSLALNVLVELVRRAAGALPIDYDIEIFEAHHRHKIDAPSGTALALADAAASGRGERLPRPVSLTGASTGPRGTGGIGFSVVRGGDVVGEHEVRFLGTGEQLRLGHVATDRAVFARGALAAARWLAGQVPGRYQMADFLFKNS